MSTRIAVTVVAATVMAACSDITISTGGVGGFSSPEFVWQQPAGTVGPLALVSTPGGRTFLFVTAGGGTVDRAVYEAEQVGTGWTQPFALPRAPGGTSEQLAWALSGEVPIVATIAGGPAGGTVYVREFVANGWTAPFPATAPGGELVESAMLAAAGGPAHLVYTVAGGSCPQASAGVIRHRRRLGVGVWNAPEPVATACGAGNLSVAAGGGPGDPVAVFWSAPSATGFGDDLLGVVSHSGAPAVFATPLRVPGWQGIALGPQVVAAGGGGFVAFWLQSSGPGYAAWSYIAPGAGTWTVPDSEWVPSAIPPWSVNLGGTRGVLSVTTASNNPMSQLVARRWASAGSPLAGTMVITTPVGPVSAPWLTVAMDGSIQAAWVETTGGIDRVLWATTLAPAMPDAGAPTGDF